VTAPRRLPAHYKRGTRVGSENAGSSRHGGFIACHHRSIKAPYKTLTMRGRPHLPSAGSCSSSQSASSQANLLPAQEDGSGSICCDIVIEDGPPELIGDPKRSLQITAVLARAQHHHHQGRSPSPDEPPHRHRRSCGYLKATIVVVAALVLGAIIVGSAVGESRRHADTRRQHRVQPVTAGAGMCESVGPLAC
jgi:hypothetical protein